MITFGLTGGIACGKSTATKTFRKAFIPMVDADIVARQVVAEDTVGIRIIADTFGKEFVDTNGALNRSAMAKLVFSNQEAMTKLNKIMAPLINEESERQIKELHDSGYRIVGYDAALIIEMGNADKYRPLIVVACPRAMQIERQMKRNGVTLEEAEARLRQQTTTEEKLKLADYIIDTSGTVEESIAQTQKIIEQFQKLGETK